MESRKDVKLYLAGPEVFLPNAAEHAEVQRELCRKYGFIGLHPMANNVDLIDSSYQTAVKIYRGNVNQIRACDIIVANCNPFRGALMDDGTAYELGFANALGKPSYGYLKSMCTYNKRMNAHVDCQNHLLTDDFGTFINLMMQCGMDEYGRGLVLGSFEDCLVAVWADLNNGLLVLK